MPVCLAEGGGKAADDDEEEAQSKELSKVSRVSHAAGKGSDEEEEEDFERTDPGYVGGGAVEHLCVVRLEDAERVDDAPGEVRWVIQGRRVDFPAIHDDKMTAHDFQSVRI